MSALRPVQYPPVNPSFPHFLHGGDYNPDQWLATPEVWDEDMRLMKQAHCNTMSVGIFSWVQLEPEEGRFTFGWLDTIMEKLAANGARAVLATPTAAHPAWMALKYPEVMRVDRERRRLRPGGRVANCLTSPVYREKCRIIGRQLAQRYRGHPALLIWHVHNEYGGECHCELCQAAFRDWLKARYGTLEKLNAAWWTGFWGHAYTAWEQVESGDGSVQGLSLDWKRFTTHQTVQCYKNEAAVLREVTPGVPVTTNTYGYFVDFDCRQWAPELDVVAEDCYPLYHERADNLKTAAVVSFQHDYYRCIKGGRPFLLMESSPSSMNWAPVMKLKRPGVHALASLQAVAHGAESVQYFQWRAGRGACEKFHGAVVAHDGTGDTRVFRDVSGIGAMLGKLDPVLGTTVPAETAILMDKEVEWALGGAAGPRNEKRDYTATCVNHYEPFWKRGVPVDVVHMDADLAPYRLVIAPMLYLMRPGAAERIEAFVRSGGIFVTTYWSGIVDESDLCFMGGRPGPLRKLLGIWSEELDVLYDDDANTVVPAKGNGLGLKGRYGAHIFCDLVHAEGARVLATYGRDFYKGRPALTVNRVGEGEAYYQAARSDGRFLDDFYGALIRRIGLRPALDAKLPAGVTAQVRTNGKQRFVFVLNFVNKPRTIRFAARAGMTDLLTGRSVRAAVTMPAYGALVLVDS